MHVKLNTSDLKKYYLCNLKKTNSMNDIKFGTDGWRAIIAKDYTIENVNRVSIAVADYLLKQKPEPVIIIGHDCRFGGKMFTESACQVFCKKGVKVIIGEGIVTTPMISLGSKEYNADMGVVITASHNPPDYNGYKLKSNFGGPSSPRVVADVEALIPDSANIDLASFDEYKDSGMVSYVDLEELYADKIKTSFDLDLIRSKMHFAYDAMFGAGFKIMNRLFPDQDLLQCTHNPSFEGRAPEPIDKNLKSLSSHLAAHSEVTCGFATDGDADRIGMYNGKGEFVDSHHIILLVMHYLCKYKGLKGKVVVAFSVTDRFKKMCEHYGLEYEVTKIGFKYIAEKMTQEEVLLGGEESGGIAIGSHIPERDGIWMGLTLIEFMAKTGKTLDELISEVYEIVGSFKYSRDDLHLTENKKQEIIEACKNEKFQAFGMHQVNRLATIDGFKYHFDNDEWIMIRPSGTEPVLRVYCEAESYERVSLLLSAVKETILN
jgi:phosphomannomutase